MKFYVYDNRSGKMQKISRKALFEAVGQDRINYIERESKQALADDPMVEIEFMIHWEHRTQSLVVRA